MGASGREPAAVMEVDGRLRLRLGVDLLVELAVLRLRIAAAFAAKVGIQYCCWPLNASTAQGAAQCTQTAAEPCPPMQLICVTLASTTRASLTSDSALPCRATNAKVDRASGARKCAAGGAAVGGAAA